MRLTKKRNGKNVIPLLYAVCGIDMPYWRIDRAYNSHEYLSGDAADKLAAYEDAEEQGLLVRLPCKVGDVIWWKNGYRIVDCHVVEIQISAERSEVIFRFGPQLNLKAGARFEVFGKTVFLTREEAEAALKAVTKGTAESPKEENDED